jgi:hypothetical protein
MIAHRLQRLVECRLHALDRGVVPWLIDDGRFGLS